MTYAAGTTVEFDKSIAEIIILVKRAGARQIGQAEGERDYAIQFTLSDRTIRFRLPLPSIKAMPTHNGRREALTLDQRREKLAQAARQRGRAIKAKLESVESGIETIEQAFLAQVVMPDQRTVHERITEHIALEYRSKRPDPAGLLPPPRPPS